MLSIPAGTGTATYTVTPVSGACTGATFTVTVTVSSTCIPVTIATDPADIDMCETSGTASFTVVAGGTAPFTYQWEYFDGAVWAPVTNGTPAGATYTNQATATLDIAGITAAGSYQYRSYITNCGGGNNATSNAATLTVNASPAAPTVAVTQPTCAVATGTIAVTSGTAGLTFSLDGAPDVAYPAGGFTTVASGPHTLTAQNAGGCISSVTNTTVDAQPATPAAPTVAVTQPTCAVATGTIAVTSTTAGLTFSLDGAPSVAYPAGGFTTVASGPHTLTAQNASGCISSVTNTTVDTQPPTPAVTDQITGILSGATFTVTPVGVPVGTTYTWTAPVVTGGVTGGAAQAVPQTEISGVLSIPAGTGTATYTVTPVSGACTGATFTVTVTVSSTCIPVTIATDPADIDMCETSGTASFTVVAGGTAPFTYQWEYFDGAVWAPVANGTPAGATYTNQATATLDVAGITAAGSYQYRSYITNCSGGNNATSNAATLTVNASPAAPTVAVTQPTCAVATGTIAVTSGTAGLTFSLDGAPDVAYPAGGFTAVASGPHTLTALHRMQAVVYLS